MRSSSFTSAPPAQSGLKADLQMSIISGSASLNQSQNMPNLLPCRDAGLLDKLRGTLTGGAGPCSLSPATHLMLSITDEHSQPMLLNCKAQ